MLLSLALLLLCGSPPSSADEPSPCDLPRETYELQKQTLAFVFYRDNPLPPPPTPEELGRATQAVQADLEGQGKELIQLYGEHPDLWAYALRDSDGDGIRDYRVSEWGLNRNDGKFIEGDTDVDGDGIRNVMDAQPYDPRRGSPDTDGDRIPDHLDWSLDPSKPEATARIQAMLFHRYRVLLVERSDRFEASTAETVRDLLTEAYGDYFEKHRRMKGLRVIATERHNLLETECEKSWNNTAAMVALHSETMLIYRYAQNLAPVELLSTLIHEVAHGYVLSIDPECHSTSWDNYYPTPRFHDLLRSLGWEIPTVPAEPVGRSYPLYTPHYDDRTPEITPRLDGRTLEQWRAKKEELGDSWLEDDEIVRHHIVGSYSLEDFGEWFADHASAHVLNRMQKSLSAFCAPAGTARIVREWEARNLDLWDFRFANASGGRAERYFSATFPLPEDAARRLARRYLLADPEFGRLCAGAP